MPIDNDQQLSEAVQRVNVDLQAIQDYLRQKDDPAGKIRFPRGFIRTAETFRMRLPFIREQILKGNLAYGLMLSDVYMWLLLRTDLTGTAREMVIKAGLFLAGALAESLTKGYLKGVVGNRQGFKDISNRLLKDRVIDEQRKDDLDWLWDSRNNMHYFLVPHREFEHYTVADYHRAAMTIRSLIEALKNAHQAP